MYIQNSEITYSLLYIEKYHIFIQDEEESEIQKLWILFLSSNPI